MCDCLSLSLSVCVCVCVTAVSLLPVATWVLLGSEDTGTRGERATAIIFQQPSQHTSPCSSRSSSSSYYVSPVDSSSSTVDGYGSYVEPSWLLRSSSRLQCGGGGGGGVGSSSEDSPSDVEVENASITSSAGSRLFELVRSFINPAINSQGVIQAESGGGQERTGSGGGGETRTPEPATTTTSSSSPPTFVSKRKKISSSHHRKTKSCSQISDSGNSSPTAVAAMAATVKLPKYVETPEMNALLRVQPHSIGGPAEEIFPGGNIMEEEKEEGGTDSTWDVTRVFDVYVHPGTFPEISNYYYCSQELGSFLVHVRPAIPPRKLPGPPPQSQDGSNEAVETARPAPPTMQSSVDTSSSSIADGDSRFSSPVSEKGLELSRLISAVAGFSQSFGDGHSDAAATSESGESSNVKPDKSRSFVLPDSLVLRLCFATKLVSCSDGMVRPLPDPPPPPPPPPLPLPLRSKLPLEFAGYDEILEIAPGHVVMSHVVRRQLRIGACSLVRVTHVKEEGRLPTAHSHATVHIRPLDPKESIMLPVSLPHAHVQCNPL